MQYLYIFFTALLLSACKPDDTVNGLSRAGEFGQPIKVEITGYNGNIMEPFLSRDGNTLLFNNLNSAPENTNLHWATKINDTTFLYKGEIAQINTIDLEAVPTLDNKGNLYFVSNRNYSTTFSTLYQCVFSDGATSDAHLIDGVSKLQPGWVNFDVEVSADGGFLYFVDAQFDQTGTPISADLVVSQKNGSGFKRLVNSTDLMKNINTGALEYAACISADQLELYFTRVEIPFTATTVPQILVSTRKNVNDAFGEPSIIKTITGFAEAPTIAPDQKTLYYHKKENNKFVLYMVKKK